VMVGYVDGSLNAEAFDENGFLRTGDLGSLDAGGNVTITGRKKDVIIRNGENISAQEIEEHLLCHPGVVDVAVVGLPHPRTGEMACAVVVADTAADPAADPVAQMTLPVLADFLRTRGLMVHKLPERLEIVERLPRSATGKVDKGELREKFGG
jgi:non-ribosomal peptide synthetase component E (peptide arylation enzyme)